MIKDLLEEQERDEKLLGDELTEQEK